MFIFERLSNYKLHTNTELILFGIHGYILADKQIEVIGNAYDNSELLEVNNNG